MEENVWIKREDGQLFSLDTLFKKIMVYPLVPVVTNEDAYGECVIFFVSCYQ